MTPAPDGSIAPSALPGHRETAAREDHATTREEAS
jgi:hypothetical protein